MLTATVRDVVPTGGSRATLLWRRGLAAEGIAYSGREFTMLELMTVRPAIVLATGLLSLGLRV